MGPASTAALPAAACPRLKQGEVSAVTGAVVAGYDVTVVVLNRFFAMGHGCELPCWGWREPEEMPAPHLLAELWLGASQGLVLWLLPAAPMHCCSCGLFPLIPCAGYIWADELWSHGVGGAGISQQCAL